MLLAAAFLFFYATALTLAPAVRLHSWGAALSWNHWIGYGLWLVGFWRVRLLIQKELGNHDPYVLPLVALLSGWGLLTIWRLDAWLGWRQTLWLGLGLILLGLGIHAKSLLIGLRRYKYFWLACGLLLTTLTLIFGTYPGGDGSGPGLWLGCCGVYIQPAEPLKLLILIYLAAYLADYFPFSPGITQWLPPTLVIIGLAAALLLAQRDLGTASLLIILYALMVFLASGRRRVLLITALALLTAALMGNAFFGIVHQRMLAWLDPWSHANAVGYQIVQSLIAVAAGGLLGSGPGLGSPGLIPVAHSDFIGIAIAEETGLIGFAGLLTVIVLLVFRCFVLALRAPSIYRRFLASGIGLFWGIQSLLILGGNLRLFPLTGITLPFVSYGGSSLLVNFAALLLLLRAGSQDDALAAPLHITLPYRLMAAGFLAGTLVIILWAGWWGLVQGEALLNRPDNLRWAIDERYVPRGRLLDRQENVLAQSEGVPGALQRRVLYPPLGPTLGFIDPLYGKAGLEAGLDGYLRGLQAQPAWRVVLARLLYAQPPEGLDVRLTLSLDIQRAADAAMEGKQGALVLMNAQSGEILAMASHPYFDPNQLQSQWEIWKADPSAPMLNRVTQGQYPPGTALTVFLWATQTFSQEQQAVPPHLALQTPTGQLPCAVTPRAPLSWESAVAAGCPWVTTALAQNLGNEALAGLWQALGFGEAPSLPLPVAGAALPPPGTSIMDLLTGASSWRVSPLQMAVALATLQQSGLRPAPNLTNAVKTVDEGWVVFPTPPATRVNLPQPTAESLIMLGQGDLPVWMTMGRGSDSRQTVTWLLAGSVPEWQGAPLVLAIALESGDATQAEAIAYQVLKAALH